MPKITIDIPVEIGTTVYMGYGIMKVTSVGMNTMYGKIAIELSEKDPISPLRNRLIDLAKVISKIERKFRDIYNSTCEIPQQDISNSKIYVIRNETVSLYELCNIDKSKVPIKIDLQADDNIKVDDSENDLLVTCLGNKSYIFNVYDSRTNKVLQRVTLVPVANYKNEDKPKKLTKKKTN